jgi:hypothetical protein
VKIKKNEDKNLVLFLIAALIQGQDLPDSVVLAAAALTFAHGMYQIC